MPSSQQLLDVRDFPGEPNNQGKYRIEGYQSTEQTQNPKLHLCKIVIGETNESEEQIQRNQLQLSSKIETQSST
jgi:hypothetical protein